MTECSSSTVPPQRLKVNDPCWLTAQGDASGVQVYRSPLIDQDDEALVPVLAFIADHGLSLVYTETDPDPAWMHGQRVREIYA